MPSTDAFDSFFNKPATPLNASYEVYTYNSHVVRKI